MKDRIVELLVALGADWTDVLLTVVLTALAWFVGAFRWITRRGRSFWQRRQARAKPPLGDFQWYDIEKETHFWIEPRVSSLNPSVRHSGKSALGAEEKLLTYLRRVVRRRDAPPYLLLLSDSGMGKTAALVNFVSSELRRDPSKRMALFSCRLSGVVNRIRAVPEPQDCDLLVDAIDEDGTARTDPIAFIELIFEAARPFRSVILTCRSQYFKAEAEIPERVGVFRFGRGLSETDQWLLERVYLCPFSDAEVDRLVRRKYSPWRRRSRQAARNAVARLGDLRARPLVLSYLDDILDRKGQFSTLFQVYSEIVAKWIERERPWVKDPEALDAFSCKLAVDLYVNSARRGGEHASIKELESLSTAWQVPLDAWQLHTRSLLTRDSDYHLRFAHRSLLEFFFVKGFLNHESNCLDVHWTELMLAFLRDAKALGNVSHIVSVDILALFSAGSVRGVAVNDVAPIVLGKMASWEILGLVLGLLKRSLLSTDTSAYMECGGGIGIDDSPRSFGAPLASEPPILVESIRSAASSAGLVQWRAYIYLSNTQSASSPPYRGWLLGWSRDATGTSVFYLSQLAIRESPVQLVVDSPSGGWEFDLYQLAHSLLKPTSSPKTPAVPGGGT